MPLPVAVGSAIAAGLLFGIAGIFIGYTYAMIYIKARQHSKLPDIEAAQSTAETPPLSNISVKEKDTTYLHKRTLRPIPEVTETVVNVPPEMYSPSLL